MPWRDWALALLFAALTVASRAPVRARLLPTWDAVQFALALGEYDIVKHQPHPPGYILYVAAGRALAALVGGASPGLVWLSIGASALTVALVYRLAWALYGRATAVVAATVLLASPLFWFYGLVGLSYTAEAALTTLVALLAWSLRHGGQGRLVTSALVLAAAGGVRQSILVVLFPLWLGATWAGFRRWRPVLLGVCVVLLGSAVWLGPMLWLTGGPRRYVEVGVELFDSTVRATTVVTGRWLLNAERLTEAFLLGLGVLLPVLVAVGVGAVRARWRRPRAGPRTWLFAGWMLPALGLYTLVHVGQYGYLLTVLPACAILVARALVAGWERWLPAGSPMGRRLAVAGMALVVVVVPHVLLVAAAPRVDVTVPPVAAPPLERWAAGLRAVYSYRIRVHTVPGLRETEDVIRAYVTAVRREFDPADTALVTEVGNPRSYPWFRHATYYLPEFSTYHLRVGGLSPGHLVFPHGTVAAPGAADVLLPGRVRRLVWMVDHWDPAVLRPPGLEARPLAHGRWLYVLPVDRRAVEHAGYRLTPVAAVARLR